jgi:hypothetical protein
METKTNKAPSEHFYNRKTMETKTNKAPSEHFYNRKTMDFPIIEMF